MQFLVLFVEFENHAFPVTERQVADSAESVSQAETGIPQQLSDEFDSLLLEGWTAPDMTETFSQRMELAVAQLKYMTERFRQPTGELR